MAKPQVVKIYTVKGKPDVAKAHVKHADVVVWIPETPEDLIDIVFTDETPFATTRLTADFRGESVGAFVVAAPSADSRCPYTYATNGIHVEAGEPEIIVDGGAGGPGPDGKGGG